MLLDLESILGNFRDKAVVNATSWDEKSTLLRVKSKTSGFKIGTQIRKFLVSNLEFPGYSGSRQSHQEK
jgi:hypothetical protein